MKKFTRQIALAAGLMAALGFLGCGEKQRDKDYYGSIDKICGSASLSYDDAKQCYFDAKQFFDVALNNQVTPNETARTRTLILLGKRYGVEIENTESSEEAGSEKASGEEAADK